MAKWTLGFVTMAVMTTSLAGAQTPPTIQRPTIDNPKVSAPSQPTVGSPTGAHAKTATTSAKTVFATRPFDLSAYMTVQNSGAATVLVFSALGDATWTKQGPILQTILRESEFRNLPQFQIDMKEDELVAKFGAKAAGTIIVMKDGEERIRSTKMTSAEVIRKLLRLTSAL